MSRPAHSQVPSREALLAALRRCAQRMQPALPDAATVAAEAGISVELLQAQLGPEANYAALLAYQPAPLDTRERIIASAAHVFAQKGFQKASLDAVAAEAGLTKGAIYWHFKNKNELFFALLDDRFRRDTSPLLQAKTELIAAGGDVRAALLAMFQGSVLRCTDDPEWARLYLECLSLSRDADVRTRLAAFYEQVWAVSADFTRDLQAHGLVPGHVDAQVSAVFWGALFDGLILAWLLKGEELPLATLLPAIFDLIWQGMAPPVSPSELSHTGENRS